MTIALTIDFEKLSHAKAYRQLGNDPSLELDLVSIVERLLDLLERTNNRVTFYVVADLVDSHAELIRRIHAAGHEIGSHTYSHKLLPGLSEKELKNEIVESKRILESVIDEQIQGFRAPELNHTHDSLRILCSAGYQYDSSAINTIPIPGFYASWDELETDDPQRLKYYFGSVNEVPLSVNPYCRLPVSGAWIRLLGRRYTDWTLRSLERRNHVPVFYLHPRAFQSISRASGLPRRIYHHSGEWSFDLVESILERYDSIPVRELVSGGG